MNDVIYVYVDKRRIIREIEFEPHGEFLKHDLVMIPKDKAGPVLELRERWNQNKNTKNNLFVLDNNTFDCNIKKVSYIYYHFKDKTIKAITPRKQENLDKDETLLSGLIIVDDLVMDFINGKRNMLDFTINDEGYFLVLNEVEREQNSFNVLDNVLLIEDYKLPEELSDDTQIEIIHEKDLLIIKKLKEPEDKIYDLFLVDIRKVFYNDRI